MGYSGQAIAAKLRREGWQVVGTGRGGDLSFGDERVVCAALADASYVLSSVPPAEDGSDAVLQRYGAQLGGRWLGYLSSTGVYGDAGGAWVDESSPVGGGRRSARVAADAAWLAAGARVFRLPGIYGPGRSVIDRLREGTAQRIVAPGQVFSRVHVDDIAGGVGAALAAGVPPMALNLADDQPADQEAVLLHACRLFGMAPPPPVPLADAALSPMARGFYAENRRVANGLLKRLASWQPRYPSYREGFAALV